MDRPLIERATNQLLVNRFSGNENDMLNALYGLQVYSGVKYWEYINVDALTALQHPKTSLPDEMIFLTFHQVCELYFKLIIHEISLIQESFIEHEKILEQVWLSKIQRVRKYFDLLAYSFEQVLSVENMDTEEFFQFRLALIPASGFQTAQFRKIEIMLTSLDNLTFDEETLISLGYKFKEVEMESSYERIYWKLGARDVTTFEKTKVLQDFEIKYDYDFKTLSNIQKELNLNYLVQKFTMSDEFKLELLNLNKSIVSWKMKHMEILGPHFSRFDDLNEKYMWEVDKSKGTGDTNAVKFLSASLSISYFNFN